MIVEGGSLELIYTDTETTDSDSLILGLTYDLSYMTVVEDTDGDVVMITFDVLDVGRIEGEFNEVNITGEISGFEWSVSDIETTGQISAVNVDALDALKDGVEVLVYPSPVKANETFEAGFMVENGGDVTLEIYDVLGRKQVSIEEQVTAYTYTRVSINPVDFEYGNMSAGVYMIVLIYEGEILAESWFGVLP